MLNIILFTFALFAIAALTVVFATAWFTWREIRPDVRSATKSVVNILTRGILK